MNLGTFLAALIPLVGIGALAFLIRWQTQEGEGGVDRSPSRRARAWAISFMAILLVGSVLQLVGLYSGDPGTLALFSLAATVAGSAALQRDRIGRKIDGFLGSGLRRGAILLVRDLVIVLLVSAIAFYAHEISWNDSISWMDATSRLWEQGMITLAMLMMYFLFQHRSWGCNFLLVALFLIGVAEYYVIVLKGSAIMPGDLFALGTAAAVSGGLNFSFGPSVLLAAAITCLGLGVLAFVSPVASAESGSTVGAAAKAGSDAEDAAAKGRIARRVLALVLNLVLAAACCMGTVACTQGAHGYIAGNKTKFWEPVKAYRANGFLTSFVSIAYEMPIRKPEGYSTEVAEQIQSTYASKAEADVASWEKYQAANAQFGTKQPAIVCIMNETFADISVLGNFGYTGPAFYNSMDDCLMRGKLYTSVLGGGTCNSEFEFLTGNSMAYVGTGKYPYNLYSMDKVETLASQLKDLGYSTTAIHPNLASNWKRDKVYQQFGFDQFIDINGFQNAPCFHSGVTDAATYDKVLDILKNNDGPQFIFDVTMQNHTGYDQFNIPQELLTNYSIPNQSDYDNAQLNEYLTCIQQSDKDLQYLIGELKKLDRPVILLFFGDHQPSISQWENDRITPAENPDSLDHIMKTYQTTYIVWANYDVAENSQTSENRATSVNYLSAILAQQAGIPLTDYQKANLGMSQTMPAISAIGAMDADGHYYETTDTTSPLASQISDLENINYLNFGSRV